MDHEKFDGSQTNFARAAKKSFSQINQYLNGVRNIGEKVAREIEKNLGLSTGYLDQAARRGLWADSEPVAPWEWRKIKH